MPQGLTLCAVDRQSVDSARPSMNHLPEIIQQGNTPQRVVRLNNAATTPPFAETVAEVTEFLQTYGALHRGAGPYADKTSSAVTQAIQTIKNFLHVGPDHELLFTHNTSSAINVFARMLRLSKGDVVMTSSIEHTSNNLPWRYNTDAEVVEVRTNASGALDMAHCEQLARQYYGRLKLIAITGASNLTGYIPDLRRLSDIAHRNDALLFIDAAQLAPHRRIDMHRDGIDALAFSAHKVYAPFGIGVLALPKNLLHRSPVDPGGGSIDMLSSHKLVWAPAEERHQSGTWNATGLIALAKSCDILMQNFTTIQEQEKDLVHYTAQQLSQVPGLTLYIDAKKYLDEDRIGTFPFNLSGYHHAWLSAILDHEYNIETRAGTICNHRLVRRWIGVSDVEQEMIEEKIQQGDRLASYGIVRASIGCHNTKEDIDMLISALKNIAKNGPRLRCIPDPKNETFNVS